MFLRVVGRPIPHHHFGGKILLERLSKQFKVKKLTMHQKFTDDVIVNQDIKSGEWRILFKDSESFSDKDCIDVIVESYYLDEAFSDRLQLSYPSFIGTSCNKKEIRLKHEYNIFAIANKDDGIISLAIRDVHLKVRYKSGDMIERECTCNIKYRKML